MRRSKGNGTRLIPGMLSDRTQGNVCKLKHRKCYFNVRRNFPVRIDKHWIRCPREVLVSWGCSESDWMWLEQHTLSRVGQVNSRAPFQPQLLSSCEYDKKRDFSILSGTQGINSTPHAHNVWGFFLHLKSE